MIKTALAFLITLAVSIAGFAQAPPSNAPPQLNKSKNVWAGDNFEQVCIIQAVGSPGTFTPACPSNNITITASGQTIALPTVGTPPGYQPGGVTKSLELNIFYAAPYVPVFATGYAWQNGVAPAQCTGGSGACLAGVVSSNPDLIECRTASETLVRCAMPLTAMGSCAPMVWSATHLNGNLSGGGTTALTSNGSSTTNYTGFGKSNFVPNTKIYWESAAGNTTDNGRNTGHGVGNTSTTTADNTFLGQGADSVGAYPGSGVMQIIWNAHAVNLSIGMSGALGSDRIAQALDLVNNMWWASDVTRSPGVWYGASTTAGDPASNSGGFNLTQSSSTITAQPVVPGISLENNGDIGTGYFLSSTWSGTPPSGFRAICG